MRRETSVQHTGSFNRVCAVRGSARRHRRKVSRHQERLRRDCDHVPSKRVVQSVEPGATLAFEDLTDIRDRVPGRIQQGRRLHG